MEISQNFVALSEYMNFKIDASFLQNEWAYHEVVFWHFLRGQISGGRVCKIEAVSRFAWGGLQWKHSSPFGTEFVKELVVKSQSSFHKSWLWLP